MDCHFSTQYINGTTFCINMAPLKFYKYKCRKCHACIVTYIQKDKCECGYAWKIVDEFILHFPGPIHKW